MSPPTIYPRLAIPLPVNSWNFDLFRKVILMLPLEPTERGLLLDILDKPTDSVLHLIYADWLEEHNRMEEAIAERAAGEYIESRKHLLSEGHVASGMIVLGSASSTLLSSGVMLNTTPPSNSVPPPEYSGYTDAMCNPSELRGSVNPFPSRKY